MSILAEMILIYLCINVLLHLTSKFRNKSPYDKFQTRKDFKTSHKEICIMLFLAGLHIDNIGIKINQVYMSPPIDQVYYYQQHRLSPFHLYRLFLFGIDCCPVRSEWQITKQCCLGT